MPSRSSAIHHNQKQKRVTKPHPVLDRLIYVAAIASPIMTLPQLWKIWIEQNASGISVITWSTYLIVSFVWLYYGVVHKERVIIFNQLIWLIMIPGIIIGTVLYG